MYNESEMSGSDPVSIEASSLVRQKCLQSSRRQAVVLTLEILILILLFLEIVLDVYSETYFPSDETLYFLPEGCVKDIFDQDCFSDVMAIKSIGANSCLSLCECRLIGLETSRQGGWGSLLPASPLPLASASCAEWLCPTGTSKVGPAQK